MKRILCAMYLVLGLGCGEEEPPPNVPVISSPQVLCEGGSTGEYPTVTEVSVVVTDDDRDLVSSSVTGFINGLSMDSLADDDADDRFTWTPPVEFTPPLVCNAEFTIVIAASDAGGRTTEETLVVEGNEVQ